MRTLHHTQIGHCYLQFFIHRLSINCLAFSLTAAIYDISVTTRIKFRPFAPSTAIFSTPFGGCASRFRGVVLTAPRLSPSSYHQSSDSRERRITVSNTLGFEDVIWLEVENRVRNYMRQTFASLAAEHDRQKTP